MADRQGGKAGDVGTKQDQPADTAGQGMQQVQDQSSSAAEEFSQSQAAEAAESAPSSDPGRSGAAAADAPDAPAAPGDDEPAEPEAEGTAAAETEIDKAAADVVAEVDAPEKPRRRRGRRGASEEQPAAEPEPEPEPEKPARTRERPSRAAARTNGAAPVVRAQAKYVRTSARKARLVCDHIRGKSVDEARAILAFTPRAVARDWSKLLESAIANAEHNHELIGDDLLVATAFADEGPTLKRFQPRAMGRATKIRKRTSHLTITLSPKEGS
jgi:ribosomal protein L22